jgi:hypothetical protein
MHVLQADALVQGSQQRGDSVALELADVDDVGHQPRTLVTSWLPRQRRHRGVHRWLR